MHNLDLFLGITLELALCWLIIDRKLMARWPSVFAYCLWDLCWDLIISARAGHNRAALFVAWYIGSALIRIWIGTDVLRSLPGLQSQRKSLLLFIVPASVAMSFGAVAVSMQTPVLGLSRMIAAAHTLDRCSNFTLASFLTASLLAIAFLGIGWSRQGSRIAAGLTAKTSGGMVASVAINSATLHPAAKYILIGSAVTGLVFWIRGVSVSDRAIFLPTFTNSDSVSAHSRKQAL